MSTRPLYATSRRSRSPIAADSPQSRHCQRPRSPQSHHHRHNRAANKRPRHDRPTVPLPENASSISKHDFKRYRSIFALYLEVQKQRDINELPDDEVRGRWKSFVGKWNRGELAAGWYGSEMFAKSEQFVAEAKPHSPVHTREPLPLEHIGRKEEKEESSDDDMPGPALPGGQLAATGRGTKSGPAIPNMQDLELQKELCEDSAQSQLTHLRTLRRLDRLTQKEQLDDLVPRAEAGTKDRQLEKKREKVDSNRAFACAKTEAMEDVPEADLFGGGDEDGVEGFKKRKREVERKRNEREVRRDEVLRARQEEREERVREYREREERTMSGLVALARARFG